MSKGQTKAEIAAEKLKKERATQAPLKYSSAPTTGLPTQGPKRQYMSLSDSMMSTSKANKPAVEKPSRQTVKDVKVDSKPLKGIGSRQVDSPTPFRSSDQANLKAIADNFNSPSVDSKKIAKQQRTDNKISRIENRQKKRADRIIKRESQGLDASVSRSKLSTGAKRLNKLRNK